MTATRLAGLTLIALAAAAAGLALAATLGTPGNPGIAGALAGMALARLPTRAFAAPLAQSAAHAAAASAALAAGQALLLPIGIPAALGRPDLVAPLLLGACLALAADAWLMWRLFATPSFPADAAWPQGTAAAAVIRAGHEGERPGATVLLGMAIGLVGAAYRAPMAAFGVALFGNPWALSAFAAGTLVRGHTDWLADLAPAQGLLAGAALAALVHLARAAIARAALAHLAIALALALAGGLHAALPPAQLALFLAFAAAAALLHAVTVAIAAMQAGWLPSLAAAMVILAIGQSLGFPATALCLLAGHAAATGPGMAAMGQSLAAAHALGADRPALADQAKMVLAAFALAAALAWIAHGWILAATLPPGGRIFAIAIRAGGGAEGMWPWAILGAALQLAGGVRRQLGVMLAVGMLLVGPAIGWAVLAGLLLRLAARPRRKETMAHLGAGIVAGDAIFQLYDLARR